jgi:hypothetical protein
LDEAFRVAIDAVELGRQVRPGRVADRARRFRRRFGGSSAAPVVRDFDDRLHAAQF